MADLNACRICLVHGNNEKLLRIYENGGKLANEIFLVASVKVRKLKHKINYKTFKIINSPSRLWNLQPTMFQHLFVKPV